MSGEEFYSNSSDYVNVGSLPHSGWISHSHAPAIQVHSPCSTEDANLPAIYLTGGTAIDTIHDESFTSSMISSRWSSAEFSSQEDVEPPYLEPVTNRSTAVTDPRLILAVANYVNVNPTSQHLSGEISENLANQANIPYPSDYTSLSMPSAGFQRNSGPDVYLEIIADPQPQPEQNNHKDVKLPTNLKTKLSYHALKRCAIGLSVTTACIVLVSLACFGGYRYALRGTYMTKETELTPSTTTPQQTCTTRFYTPGNYECGRHGPWGSVGGIEIDSDKRFTLNLASGNDVPLCNVECGGNRYYDIPSAVVDQEKNIICETLNHDTYLCRIRSSHGENNLRAYGDRIKYCIKTTMDRKRYHCRTTHNLADPCVKSIENEYSLIGHQFKAYMKFDDEVDQPMFNNPRSTPWNVFVTVAIERVHVIDWESELNRCIYT